MYIEYVCCTYIKHIKLFCLVTAMKVNKTISMEIEVAQLLDKEKNSSKLIEDLLRNYFCLGQKLKESMEDLEKKIPREIMDDFYSFPSMSEEILRLRWSEKYSKRFEKLGWVELLEGFNTFRGADDKPV